MSSPVILQLTFANHSFQSTVEHCQKSFVQWHAIRCDSIKISTDWRFFQSRPSDAGADVL